MYDEAESIDTGAGIRSYVVRGAVLSCTFGSSQSILNLPISHGVFIKDQAQMNINDHTPIENIGCFGMCSAPPKLTPNPTPCTVTTPLPWMIGKMTTKIEKIDALMNDSIITCTFGGVIKIEDDGQK